MGKVKSTHKKIFFNYGTVGLMGKPAYKAASSFLDEYFRVGPPEVLFKYEPYAQKLCKEVAELLNCSEQEITHIKNTSEGIIIASEALPLKRGDEVLVGGNEYPANLLPWLKKRKEGIDVRVITSVGSAKTFHSIISAISPRTKAISISWGQNYDGYIVDLDLLSTVCKDKGIFLIVDGVQCIGIRQIDLQKTSVDFLICGGQKYIGGIMGIGLMYVNKNIIGQLKDTKVGIRSMKHFDTSSYVLKDTADRFQDGTQNLLGIVALHAAIKHINSVGIKNVERKNLNVLKKFKNYLQKNEIPFLDHEHQSNIISLPTHNAQELAIFLRNQNMYIKPINDVVRISFTQNSSFSDFKYLIQKIQEWRVLNFSMRIKPTYSVRSLPAFQAKRA